MFEGSELGRLDGLSDGPSLGIVLGSMERTAEGRKVGANVVGESDVLASGLASPDEPSCADVTKLVGVSDGDGDGAGESVGGPEGADTLQLGDSDGDGEG